MEYIIDYQNGNTEEYEGNLEGALKYAEDGMGFTQESVYVKRADGTERYVSRWYGVPAGEDDAVLIDYTDFGFYADWEVL